MRLGPYILAIGWPDDRKPAIGTLVLSLVSGVVVVTPRPPRVIVRVAVSGLLRLGPDEAITHLGEAFNVFGENDDVVVHLPDDCVIGTPVTPLPDHRGNEVASPKKFVHERLQ